MSTNFTKVYFPTELSEHEKYFIYLEIYKIAPIEIQIEEGAGLGENISNNLESFSVDSVYNYKTRTMDLLEVMRLPLQQTLTESVGGSFEPTSTRKLGRLSQLASGVLGGDGGGGNLLQSGRNYLMDSLLGGQIGDEFGVGDSLAATASSALGKAINENEQLSYKGPTRRDWPFEFVLIARNINDARTMQVIRRRLQYHASPGLSSGDGYWEYPHFFRFKFQKYNHVNNSTTDIENLFYSKFCFMESVSVKTGNERYDEFSDGRGTSLPGYMQISFSLKETNFATKKDFEEGSEYLTGRGWGKADSNGGGVQ